MLVTWNNLGAYQAWLARLHTCRPIKMQVLSKLFYNRKQRVKLSQYCISKWGDVPAGVPQLVVKRAKLLGFNISSDLKWNFHVSEIVRKVSSSLYLLRQLKRANADASDLLLFYTTCIRPVTKHCCQPFHYSLSNYLSGPGCSKGSSLITQS